MLTHYYGVYDCIIISGLLNILSHHVQNFSFWNGVKPRILPLSPLGAVLRFSSRFRINALPYIPSTPGSHTPCRSCVVLILSICRGSSASNRITAGLIMCRVENSFSSEASLYNYLCVIFQLLISNFQCCVNTYLRQSRVEYTLTDPL